MFKKISYAFIFMLLIACKTTGSTNKEINFVSKQDIFKETFGDALQFRVGMLLPLTGSASKQGEGLRNAALLALEDVNNPNMLLQFYDTKSTAGGARIAIENALSQKTQMIIGPLMAEEVKAVTPQISQKKIPLITFSTNNEVLSEGIYSLGLLVDEQVDRVISYASENKYKKIALLLPDNNTGIAVAKAAIISANKNGAEIVRIGFYPPNISNFSSILEEMTDYKKRSKRIKDIKEKLSTKATAGDETSKRILTRLKGIDSLGKVDFDAILIPETGQKLKAATSMLSYYDAGAPEVKILGTSLWSVANINRENSLEKAWYPAISDHNNEYFIKKYVELFDETPNNLYAFAYDAVALASIVTQNKSNADIDQIITRDDGYIGINGIFRIFPNGTNQHGLSILEVNPKGDVIIDKAPLKFDKDIEFTDFRFVRFDNEFIAPLIFGKERILAQTQIFGAELPIENQPIIEEIYEEDEAEIIRKELSKYRIKIP